MTIGRLEDADEWLLERKLKMFLCYYVIMYKILVFKIEIYVKVQHLPSSSIKVLSVNKVNHFKRAIEGLYRAMF